MVKCQRCKRSFDDPREISKSIFNNQDICKLCATRERSHPEFRKAREALLEEISKGNYDYTGVGLPVELEGARN